MQGYIIQQIVPGLVKIYEEPEPYFMNEESILKVLETIKEHRNAYASDVHYLRRLELFEDALQVAQQGKK
jgi:hypothetical protein